MGVWWMEGNTEQSREKRMIPRLTTGAVAGTVRLAREKYEVGGIRGSLGYIVWGACLISK